MTVGSGLIEAGPGHGIKEEKTAGATLAPATAAAATAAVEQIIDKLRAKKFKKAILTAAASLPENVAALGKRLTFEGAMDEAYYSPPTQEIHMSLDPKNWYGTVTTFFHEFGHHLHMMTGVVTETAVRPDFAEAIKKDRQAWETAEQARLGSAWSKNWAAHNPLQAKEEAAAMLGLKIEPVFSLKDQEARMPERKRISRVADTVMGLTNGNFGAGHDRPYMRAHGAKEVFAHAFAALMDGDMAFQQLFKNVVAVVKKEFKLPNGS